MMLQEAGEFANHLKKVEKDIRGLKTATEGAAGRPGPPLSRSCRAAACTRCAPAVAPSPMLPAHPGPCRPQPP